MSLNDNELYAFQDFRLDVGERLLLRSGRRIQLPDKAFETLCVLVRQKGHLVTKDELLRKVWPNTVVEENNLDKSVSSLRHVLGEVKGKQKFIETVRGRGYRFVGDVQSLSVDDDISAITVPPNISSSRARKALSARQRKQGAGNLATVVSLSDRRHEPEMVHEPEEALPSAKGTAQLSSSRRYWLVAVVITACTALGLLGFYSLSGDRAAASINSVAVLPFVNVSGDKELEYFSDGLSETLIDRLSELPQLKVIARNSSFKFREENIDLQDVAQKLGVQAIVTGRVVRRGDDLSIRVELIDVPSNKQIWGEQFNRKAADALATGREIAQTISGKLRLKLSSEQEQRLAKRGTDNPQAYDVLLKGDFLATKSENWLKAIECYRQAISLDQNYALAYSRLSRIYGQLAGNSVLDPKTTRPMAQSAAQRAVDLDDDLAEAHLELGNLALYAWDWTTAENEYRRALALNPNLSTAHQGYSRYLSDMGRHEEAIAEARRTRELDPQRLASHTVVSTALLIARQFDESIAETRKILELDSKAFSSLATLGYAYAGKGMYRDAIAAYEESVRLGNVSLSNQIYLGAAYARAGERIKAVVILRRLETSKEYVAPGELAILYEALGDRDKAVETLEKAYAAHDLQLQHLNADPGFDAMHSDPRFQDLVRRVGLPQFTSLF